jgi:predicted nucleic acid-binding protein
LVYAEIYHDLRSRGRVLSQLDMMLAALSRSMDAVLLTDDRDFEALPDLQIEN